MGRFKDPEFGERRTAADEARQKALEKFRARPGPDDPDYRERQAARQAGAAAREARDAERKVSRKADAEAAEAVLQADREAKDSARAAAAQEDADRADALAAEQKAARDARYAARKARKR